MGGESAAANDAKPTTAGATEDVAPDEGPTGPPAANANANAGGEKTTSSAGAAVNAAKDNLPIPSSGGGKENASGGGGHARRGSVFDKLKDRFKGGKSSSGSGKAS